MKIWLFVELYLKMVIPIFGLIHSDEARKKMSERRMGKTRPEGSGKPSQKIEVIDIKNNITTIYDSISATAVALKMGRATISKYLLQNDQKFYRNQYSF